MVFRCRYTVQGGRVHCRLFVAPAKDKTFAKCGDFCVSAGAEMNALFESTPTWEYLKDSDSQGDVPSACVDKSRQ